MVNRTKIEWTEVTWNPVTGCTKISPGCRNCYAERMAKRLAGRCGYPADEPFRVTLHPEKLDEPLKWKKPRRVFVCSMGDLFHEDVKDEWILATFVAMGLTYDAATVDLNNVISSRRQRHTYMILTKRPDRMKTFIERLTSNKPDEEWEQLSRYYASVLSHNRGDLLPVNAVFDFYAWLEDGMPGLWFGVSVENQQAADERIPILLQIPAVRFVSCEPLLGPVNLSRWLGTIPGWTGKNSCLPSPLKESLECLSDIPPTSGIDWVICGGETGPGARPCHPDWVRSLRDQCQAAKVPFFFKSWGEYIVPEDGARSCRVCGCTEHNACEGGCWWVEDDLCSNCAGQPTPNFRAVKYQRVGKKRAGRILDGRTWDEMPITK